MRVVYSVIFVTIVFMGRCSGDLLISQYVDTIPGSGSKPKGIELWNSSTMPIDFSVMTLDILKGTNGGVLSSDFTLAAGMLAANSVMVIGTDDIGVYLAGAGLGSVQFHDKTFIFNGDDALQVQLGGVIQDTFGTPGSDPGTAWSGGGVSTADQNIALKLGITMGDLDGWSDPSERYSMVSSGASLDGFGIVPVPEPSSFAFMTLVGSVLVISKKLFTGVLCFTRWLERTK